MRKSNIIVEENLEDENVENLAYQDYWCNVNDFSLFIIISIYTSIYLYTLTLVIRMKEPNFKIVNYIKNKNI